MFLAKVYIYSKFAKFFEKIFQKEFSLDSIVVVKPI